jgi:hypothetical protein
MQQKSLRLRRHLPLPWRKVAPLIDLLADFVDQNVSGDLVLQRKLALLVTPSAGRRHRNDVDAVAPIRQFLAGWLAVLIEFEVPFRPVERRIYDRSFAKTHFSLGPPRKLHGGGVIATAVMPSLLCRPI